MPLQATSGAASYDAFGGGVPVTPVYIEDVMSVWLYTGNGSTQTINNGIDLSGKGGLVWIKSRTNTSGGATSHALVDSARGVSKWLATDNSGAEATNANLVTAFNAAGFSVGNAPFWANENSIPYASWTFRKQPKFFDIVTYTGDGTTNRSISHNLGSTPGCLIVKRVTGSTLDWHVYHRSLNTPLNKILVLNSTSAEIDVGSPFWGVSSTDFSLPASGGGGLNTSGATYVAYLYAHDSGGFGLTGTDNVISCGSFTTDGSGNATVNLGYEPQWVMVKPSSNPGGWAIVDSMRGNATLSGTTNTEQLLFANTSGAESSSYGYANPTSTGFQAAGWGVGTSFIYIAIRRGPMKTPTTGTSVYNAINRSGTRSSTAITGVGFPVDLSIDKLRDSTSFTGVAWFDRLRGPNRLLNSTTTNAELTGSTTTLTGFDSMNGVQVGIDDTYGAINYYYSDYINYYFRRAPGFFDEVCWSGDGTGNPRNHNLTVYPELVISKLRSGGAGFGAWSVQNNINPSAKQTGVLNTTAAFSSSGATSPTATVFYPTDDQSAATYVSYLFATCPGVSKVGTYTGTGAAQTIDCGFTGGARFVLIKCTNAAGDWYVWDSARGMVFGTDPYLRLNSTAAEFSNLPTGTYTQVTSETGGFGLSAAEANVNINSYSYIFLAIA